MLPQEEMRCQGNFGRIQGTLSFTLTKTWRRTSFGHVVSELPRKKEVWLHG